MRFPAFGLFVIALFGFPLISIGDDNAFVVEVGNQETVISGGSHGFQGFPDQSMQVIQQSPLKFTLVANKIGQKGHSTYLMSGDSFRTARPERVLINPGGRGDFDNGYAGSGALFYLADRKEWLIFYHAEDSEGMGTTNFNKNIPAGYWSVGVAVLDEASGKVTKLGQILTPSIAKDRNKENHGIGDVCVTTDPTGKYIYLHYTDITRKEPIAQIGVARCAISDGGRPGKWFKYFDGGFTEPGLGGREAGVVFRAYAPEVTWSEELDAYLMVCDRIVGSDIDRQQPQDGGIHLCYSKNGIDWSEPQLIVPGFPLPYENRSYTAHPSLVIEKEANGQVSGSLFYAHTPRLGRTAESAHYLVRRPITIKKRDVGTLPDPLPPAWARLKELQPKVRGIEMSKYGAVLAGDLSGVRLSPLDVRAIASLRTPVRISFRGCGLNDEAVAYLTNLQNAESLDLSQNTITDQSIPTLASLKSLKRLNLNETKMTSDGVSRLRAELKGCQISFDGADSSAAPSNEIVRLKLAMDEFGNCTVSVESTGDPLDKATEFSGEAVKSSRLPKTAILNNKKGLVRLVHDFSNPDEFDVLFTEVLGKPQNARFDQRFKGLTLTSTREDDALVTYAYRFKPPFTVIYDRYPLTDNTVLLTVIGLGTLEDSLHINLFSLNRSDKSSAKLAAFWIETTPNGQQNRIQLIDPFEFKLDKGVSKTFRLPLPNVQIESPCFLSLKGKSLQHSVQEIAGLLIEGKVTPLYGVGLDERRGVVFAKQVVKGSLAEQAGIQTGDVIVSINKEKPTSVEQATTLLSSTVLGDTATLEIERAGTKQVIKIKSE